MDKDITLTKNEKSSTKSGISDAVEYVTPNIDRWNSIALILLLATAFWHLKNIAGWLNGKTLVDGYGINDILATAISKCPDILFYATYFAMALSVGLFIYTLVMLGLYIFDRRNTYETLNPVLICSIISVWAFPALHIVTDLVATAMEVRETLSFDVFQLGIDTMPMLITTAVCIVFIELNKRLTPLAE